MYLIFYILKMWACLPGIQPNSTTYSVDLRKVTCIPKLQFLIRQMGLLSLKSSELNEVLHVKLFT